ncbi:hypothetical protein ACE01N_20565 [Saccharicrinis sp. FJH2]|uniref:hypothetical protein n=1 Tax=Saccharicrinis sp. FJH65 TaxID=3344659 RepID=UPI0035F4F037
MKNIIKSFPPSILILMFLLSYCQTRKNNFTDLDSNVYIAHGNFGGINSQISNNILDSLINVLPYWRLDNYKTTNFIESLAVDLLRNKLELKELKTSEFLIFEITIENDSIFVFHLDHIDSYVYKYNLDKANSELSKKPLPDGTIEVIPPITGNVSGHEGWYRVDLDRNELEVDYAQ